jgi:hypothetical protein
METNYFGNFQNFSVNSGKNKIKYQITKVSKPQDWIIKPWCRSTMDHNMGKKDIIRVLELRLYKFGQFLDTKTNCTNLHNFTYGIAIPTQH